MTTKLAGDATFFLPFNMGNGEGVTAGAGNPTFEDKYSVSYMWEDILTKDTILDLISKFIFVEVKEKVDDRTGKVKRSENLIFPRYHQLDVIRKVLADVRVNRTAQNYLIQHSAGSGKTNSIAWLAHRLSSLHDSDNKIIFDNIIIVTDRVVVDRQLQKAIMGMEHKTGLIRVMDDKCNSADLAIALNGNTKIIATTIQKFPYIVDSVKDLKNKRFAVIIDEAHSSTAGKDMAAVTMSLGSGEQIDADVEDMISDEIKRNGKQANVSMFAFTATPKPTTIQLFGRLNTKGQREAFHVYSMKQAIEEGFILDVLQNYTEYSTFYQINKEIEDDYQYENAISTYLWLRYPDKYYIFKLSEVKAVASELEADYRFKKGAYADNIRNFLKLYDEISEYLKSDTELVNIFQSQLTDACYSDPELKTLTIDVGFYISRYYSKKDAVVDTTTGWYGVDYDPGLSVDDWDKLLKDRTIFTVSALEIMRRMKDYGGVASCTQLAVKYGETPNFYNSGSVALAKRVCESTGITPATREDGSTQWWTILYTGRDAGKDEDGSFVWKLRDELSTALDKVDLSEVELYVATASGEADRRYWWLNANPKIWSFSDIAVGDVQSYTLYNENGNKRRIFQNFLDAKAGDMIIGYESNPVKQIVAIGRISAEQDGEKLFFEKVEGLTSPIDYATLKECPELERMEYFQNPQGSLFKLTRGEYDFILDMIRDENPVVAEDSIDTYTKDDFLNEVYMTEKRYERLVAVLRNKKNIILQGAPGVGKTFAARRLAWSMMGEKDDSRIEFVQFHQNYSYEDFMMGYKPSENAHVR